MNQKGIVLSGLIYALLVFFLLLLASFLTVLWYRQSAINNLGKDAHDIYDEVPIPFTTDFSYSEGVNVPKLSDGLTPIKWDGSAWITTNESDSAWYDYKNKEWANARTEDGSMWVWIPRYAYQITSGYHTNTAGVISVKFLIDLTNTSADGTTTSTSPTYIADSQTNYITHPAFTFGDTELTGIWVAKFEASPPSSSSCYTTESSTNCNVTTITPILVPSVKSWRHIRLGNMFIVSRNMETNSAYGWELASGLNVDGTFTTDTNGVDTHMMKNIEWGAVAYLTQSTYGKNAEITLSYDSLYYTGGGSDNSYIINVEQSTTGNIYGIYDISGLAWEYVMGNYNNTSASSGLTPSSINDKYIDRYIDYNNTKYGDAVYETSSSPSDRESWYEDCSDMITSSSPWFLRGGNFIEGSDAGAFYFYPDVGIANSEIGFRPVLLVDDGL